MDQQDYVIYKDYIIWVIAYILDESGEWGGKVNILKKDGKTIKPFLLEETFKTAKDAIRHSLEFGKWIVDGKISNCNVEDF